MKKLLCAIALLGVMSLGADIVGLVVALSRGGLHDPAPSYVYVPGFIWIGCAVLFGVICLSWLILKEWRK